MIENNFKYFYQCLNDLNNLQEEYKVDDALYEKIKCSVVLKCDKINCDCDFEKYKKIFFNILSEVLITFKSELLEHRRYIRNTDLGVEVDWNITYLEMWIKKIKSEEWQD